jgi:hypothetical protein
MRRLAAGGWLLAAGCWRLAAGCWLLAAGYWLLAAGCWLLARLQALICIDFHCFSCIFIAFHSYSYDGMNGGDARYAGEGRWVQSIKIY